MFKRDTTYKNRKDGVFMREKQDGGIQTLRERIAREYLDEEMRILHQKQQEQMRAEIERSDNQNQYLIDRESEFVKYRNQIQLQEKELHEYRAKLKKEMFEREKQLQQEFDKREKLFVERERQFLEKQTEYSRRVVQNQFEFDEMRNALEEEFNIKSAELKSTIESLNLEKQKYEITIREKIEQTASVYVSEALVTLEQKEVKYHKASKLWSFIGAGSLGFGLLIFSMMTIASLWTYPSAVTWEFIVFSLFKGAVGIVFAAGLAKYAFLFSNSYMREALKNADRSHAINFGKFYLQSYGAAAEWSQVKEAFEHWNITGENAFSPRNEQSVGLATIDKITSVIEKTIQNSSILNKKD
jgi:small-conductance mechanosensitive channel